VYLPFGAFTVTLGVAAVGIPPMICCMAVVVNCCCAVGASVWSSYLFLLLSVFFSISTDFPFVAV
jgi:hypothetical protein